MIGSFRIEVSSGANYSHSSISTIYEETSRCAFSFLRFGFFSALIYRRANVASSSKFSFCGGMVVSLLFLSLLLFPCEVFIGGMLIWSLLDLRGVDVL